MSVDRVQSVQNALRDVQAHAAALEELGERLSLSVHTLEMELGALAAEARALREQAELSPPAAPGGAVSEAPSGDAVANGAPAAPARSTDADGARLVALNMALEGEPRESAGRYLAEHFDLPDRERLLDEVYAAVEA